MRGSEFKEVDSLKEKERQPNSECTSGMKETRLI